MRVVGGWLGGGGGYNLQHPRSGVRTARWIIVGEGVEEVPGSAQRERQVRGLGETDLCVGSGGRTSKSTGR